VNADALVRVVAGLGGVGVREPGVGVREGGEGGAGDVSEAVTAAVRVKVLRRVDADEARAV